MMTDTQNPTSTTEMWERVREALDQMLEPSSPADEVLGIGGDIIDVRKPALEALDSLRTRMEELEDKLEDHELETESLKDQLVEVLGMLDVSTAMSAGLRERLTQMEQERDEAVKWRALDNADLTADIEALEEAVADLRARLTKAEAVIEAARMHPFTFEVQELRQHNPRMMVAHGGIEHHKGATCSLCAALASYDQEEEAHG